MKLRKVTFPMVKGSMLHEIARRINELIIQDKEALSPDEVTQIIDEEVKQLDNYKLTLETYDYTKKAMMLFAEKAFANSRLVIACEKPILMQLGETTVEGRIDELSIDAKEAGWFYVKDYKSSPMVPTMEQVKFKVQYNIYALAVYKEFKDEIKKLFVIQESLDTGIQIKAEISLEQLQSTEDWLRIMWDQMKAEKDWLPNTDSSKCFYCPKRCQAYLDMCQTEYKNIDVAEDPEAVFDNYLALKTRTEAMSKQMESFKEAVKQTLALAENRLVEHKGIKYHLVDKHRVNPIRLVETESHWNEISVVKDVIAGKKGGKK